MSCSFSLVIGKMLPLFSFFLKFGTYYPDPFGGVEFYNLAGILIQDYDGSRLMYNQWWTLREDMNADGYHNHTDKNINDTFAEIHMSQYAATASSGMQSQLPGTKNLRYQSNPSGIPSSDAHEYNFNGFSEVQLSIPMPPGFTHGP